MMTMQDVEWGVLAAAIIFLVGILVWGFWQANKWYIRRYLLWRRKRPYKKDEMSWDDFNVRLALWRSARPKSK